VIAAENHNHGILSNILAEGVLLPINAGMIELNRFVANLEIRQSLAPLVM